MKKKLWLVRNDGYEWLVYGEEESADRAIDFFGSGIAEAAFPVELLSLCSVDDIGIKEKDEGEDPGTCFEIEVSMVQKWIPAIKRKCPTCGAEEGAKP